VVQEVILSDGQALEVIDIENQYSTFSGYYGAPGTDLCRPCGFKHRLCQ
jgi:hypothetical protein